MNIFCGNKNLFLKKQFENVGELHNLSLRCISENMENGIEAQLYHYDIHDGCTLLCCVRVLAGNDKKQIISSWNLKVTNNFVFIKYICQVCG